MFFHSFRSAINIRTIMIHIDRSKLHFIKMRKRRIVQLKKTRKVEVKVGCNTMRP